MLQSTPFKLTSNGNLEIVFEFYGDLQTNLTVESKYALTTLSPNLQWGTIPYSGIYLKLYPMTSTKVSPFVSPDFGCILKNVGFLYK